MMTSLQRIQAALTHQEADRVPFFLPLTMHGAKELHLSIREYFNEPKQVARGQLLLQKKYGHDALYTFFYAALEVEAWGGEVIFRDDSPPNSGEPIIRTVEDIGRLEPPRLRECRPLHKVLDATRTIRQRAGADIPIIGVVMSPYSLPVMQMGFAEYVDVLYEQPARFEQLMRLNEHFCVEWANAQLAAGATAIVYFCPLSSTDIIPGPLYKRTGFPVARRTIAKIKGPTALHLASSRSLAALDDMVETGAVVASASALDDLALAKTRCRGKIALIGNLNSIEMVRWTPRQAEDAVRQAIAQAGRGGGFILSDHHGEIPFQVSHEVLAALSDAVRKWGQFPLEWVKDNDGKTANSGLPALPR
jgi:uroporphyrinogen decarboxylase